LHEQTAAFNATELSTKANPPPSDTNSPLGLILGIIFGLLVVIAVIIAAFIYVWHRREAAKNQEEPEPDSVTTFYNDNRAEVEREFEMAFENPVFDDNAAGASSEAFDNDSVEALEL
jgi:hypothetical protein